ncbi:MAG: hypothetical protein NTV52_28085 [Acidobacteria bacterium]|nr:hypothetical protein [Acidobacteriota bacterium]
METIQVVLDTELLQAADRVLRETKQTRSTLIRDALRQHLKTLSIRALEERERLRYEAMPQVTSDVSDWEAEAVWPES